MFDATTAAIAAIMIIDVIAILFLLFFTPEGREFRDQFRKKSASDDQSTD